MLQPDFLNRVFPVVIAFLSLSEGPAHYIREKLFDDLFASFGICDQACLIALSHSSGTISSWLKAFPQVSLGWAQFVMGWHI